MIQRGMKWLGLAAGTSFVGLVLWGGAVVSAQDKGDMQEVKLELPKAVFAGTPKVTSRSTSVGP